MMCLLIHKKIPKPIYNHPFARQNMSPSMSHDPPACSWVEQGHQALTLCRIYLPVPSLSFAALSVTAAVPRGAFRPAAAPEGMQRGQADAAHLAHQQLVLGAGGLES